MAIMMLAASQHRSRRPYEDDKGLRLSARLTRVIEVEEAVDNLVSLHCWYKSGRSIARREP